MTQEKKEKCAKVVCNPHHFIITGWTIKGGMQNATHMRCAQCMMPVNLEQLESQEWKDKNGF